MRMHTSLRQSRSSPLPFSAPRPAINACARQATRSPRELAKPSSSACFAIQHARFFLRDMHNVVSTRESSSARVKMTNQLQRDLRWWTIVPIVNTQ